MVLVEAPARKFNVTEYYRMAEAGILHEDDRIELIEGKIVEMTPIGSRHALCLERLNRVFQMGVKADQGLIRIQDPIRLSDETEPQPDLVIASVTQGEDRYADAHPAPEDVLLVVEVADSSLVYDRNTKVPLYAAAGIPEYWLIDLVRNRIEVYRSPSSGSFKDVRTFDREDVASPLHFPKVQIRLADLTT